MEQAVVKRFLTNTDETGRLIVKSLKTNKIYFIEPISNGRHADWGDINPSTKQVEGSYGMKYTGSVTQDESLILPENGFERIETLGVGVDPFSEIERRDKEYELYNKS